MSTRKVRSLIVPIFIPFQGCPHRCIYCEQEKITSEHRKQVDGAHVTRILDHAIHAGGFEPTRNPEIAFYGGTFTRLPLDHMIELLDAASSFINRGFFQGIRVSTRPDAMDEERLAAMKKRGVQTVELGVQSMDDRVLGLSQRGHTAEDTKNAVACLKGFGFQVGTQLMPGLPGDTKEGFRSTVTRVIRLQPHMVRLYPAVVIRGTELARMFEQGRFQPLELNEAVEMCVDACIRFEQEGIRVIRMGLMSSPDLLEKNRIIAGPWHPAFGFLVRSAVYHRNMAQFLPAPGRGSSTIRITAAKNDIPLLRGYRNQGIEAIRARTGATTLAVEMDPALPQGTIRVERI